MTEFDKLFVDKEELNRRMLADLLENKVELTKEGDVYLKKTDNKPAKKILVYLLSKKVMKLQGFAQEEKESPTSIARKTCIPEGTVKRNMRELDAKGFVKRDKNGKYFIPDFFIQKIKDWLDGSGTG